MSEPIEESSLPLTSGEVKLPEGSKIILAPEKVTEKVKKERTEAQKEAFKNMRAKRLENDDKRKLAKGEKQKEMDLIKIQQEKDEEDERLKRAEELKQKLGVNVEVLKKRGRKAGTHILYRRETQERSEYKKDTGQEETKIENKNEDIAKIHQPTYRPFGTQERSEYTNPYMNMLLNKMKR